MSKIILFLIIFFNPFVTKASRFNISAENQQKVHKKYSQVECSQDLSRFDEALRNNQAWAVRIVDTWAKVDSGYLSGNSINLGDFDSCVHREHPIRTQFCLVTLTAHPESTLGEDLDFLTLKHVASFFRDTGTVTMNGFCVPKSCSINETVQFLNQRFLLKNDLVAVGGTCRDLDIKLRPIGYFANVLFSLILAIIISSTIYDIWMSKTDQKPDKLLASFSFYTNGRKLFDLAKVKSESSINCLHGLRSMSVFWIILGHRVYNTFPWGNPSDYRDFMDNNILASVIITHTIAVDTFFVMGALLMTWSTLKDCDSKRLNIFRMIWRRYIRYTPVYAAMILIIVAYDEFIFHGPFEFSVLRETCVKTWWMALLYIQNYLPANEMCLNQGWYLSVDFQLFLISPVIIWMVNKYGKWLLAVPVALCTATIAYLIAISIVYDIKVTSPDVTKDYLKYVYYVTHSRAGPWFIGMLLGYFMYVHRGKVFKVNKQLNMFLWIASISTLTSVILLHFAISTSKSDVNQAFHVSYISLSRNVWAVAISWVIFACQNLKTGGIVRWFLSLREWQVISRMGLSMFIVGIVYQVTMILNQRVPLYMNFWSLVPIYLGDIFVIALISIPTYLVFEAPPLIIENYIYRKLKRAAYLE